MICKMKEYIPNPVDTGHIQLPKELEYLVEEMAKNVKNCLKKKRYMTEILQWKP